MCPGIEVDAFFVGDIKSPEQGDAIAARLTGYDLVLAHRDASPRLGRLRTEALEQVMGCVSRIPKLGFSGFHPDALTMMDPALRGTVLGAYHSALIAGAYVAGVPRGQVADLFNAYIYARLGYFDEYAKARAFLSGQLIKLGFEADPLFAAWERIGQFMYTPNHPRIETIWAFATAVCRKHGIDSVATRELPLDELSDNVRWPVYPEIGRRLGVEGSLDFKPQRGAALDLDAYIDRVWTFYERIPPEALRDPRLVRVAGLLRAEGLGRVTEAAAA